VYRNKIEEDFETIFFVNVMPFKDSSAASETIINTPCVDSFITADTSALLCIIASTTPTRETPNSDRIHTRRPTNTQRRQGL
jgi:hypothetical protein